MSIAVHAPSGGLRISAALLAVSDITAAVLLVADLLVVVVSVLLRFLFNAPVEWADDVARGLMVGSSFFGAASALARGENAGVVFFIDRLPARIRSLVDASVTGGSSITANTDVKVGASATPIMISVAGNISVGGYCGFLLQARADSGDVLASASCSPERLVLRSRSGDVRAVVPAGRYRVDADSDGGSSRVAGLTPVEDAPFQIQALSGAGNVDVETP